MKYRSTRGTNEETFKKVLFAGLAEDGGLYVPMNWPQIDVNKIDKNGADFFKCVKMVN